ncbi:hypothetical protein [Verrucomicrobium sp. BvORR034]|uniref:hypothetical protein n=1 Tax=Verrucomicrobium sp. BvORR034 TaxID=1396418 RepID=UPI000679D72E|nr:hypothetical protein [Verrucomicrobium sp. BvORR034]
MISAVFTAILKSGREEFNAQYALAKKQFPALEAESFSNFLQITLDPLVVKVHSTNPEAAVAVAQAGYEVGLELVAQRLVGAQARHPWIQRLWEEGLPVALTHVMAAPREVIGALSNAAHQLGTVPGARPQDWLGILTRLAPLAESPETFLKAGQVAAWRCGLAHYRESALSVADTLPPELALAALTMPETSNGYPASHAPDISTWPEIRQRLQDGRWTRGLGNNGRGHSNGRDPSTSRLIRRTGAFRGFGGLFPEPPRLVVAQDQLYVRSGNDGWLLTADAFGATFHRATPEELAAARPQIPQVPAGVEVPADIGPVTSVARLDHTVAITGALTHAVLLYAVPGHGGEDDAP